MALEIGSPLYDYSGTLAPYMIRKAMFGMDTIKKGLVYVKDNIRKQHVITRENLDRPLSKRQTTPTDDGADPFVLDGRMIVPKDIQAYREFNPRDLESTQYSEELTSRIVDRYMPENVAQQMLMVFLGRSAEWLEKCIWEGSTSYQNEELYPAGSTQSQLQFFDGFMKLWVNDSSVVKITSPVALTTSNIIAKMYLLYQQMASDKPAMLASEESFERIKFVMNVKTSALYQEAQANLTFKGSPLSAKYVAALAQYQIKVVPGMPDDTIAFCEATDDINSNLWVGMNSQEDWNVKIGQPAPMGELWAMLAKWKYGVQYGWSDQIFLYTTKTAANYQ